MQKCKNIVIRLNDALRRKLKYAADYDGRPMNNMVVRLVQQCSREFEEAHGPIDLGEKK